MTSPNHLQDRFGRSAEQLRRAGTNFVIATVVRTIGSTAATPGAKALVLADGTIHEGWIGGGCVRAAVGRAAAEALQDGHPKFISLRPKEVLEREGVEAGQDAEGVRFARNGCPSKGSMDIFVEPVMAKPQLIIFGVSPVAVALETLAGSFEFDVSRGEDPGLLKNLPEGRRRFLVVATQGKGDVDMLCAALESRSEFVAFVGSRLKFKNLSEKLVNQGLSAEALARVAAPAGVHINAVTPDEIALSILAQVIQRHRKDQRPKATA